jgi:hypothetical protein
MPRKSKVSTAASLLSAARKTKSIGHNGGRSRSKAPRCPCGAMTAARAANGKHKCVDSDIAAFVTTLNRNVLKIILEGNEVGAVIA